MTEQLVIQLVVQGQQQAAAALNQTGTAAKRFKDVVGKASKAANYIGAGIAAMAYKAGDAASEVQQAMGGIESVFGKSAGTVEAWSRAAADSVGLAVDEYANAASKFGAQFKNMGLSQDQMLAGTKDMIGLGADLAATFGGSTQDAVDALSAAFRGEADSAERYGLNLSAASVQAELARKGQDKLTGTALATARAQAIMALATKQAGGSIGQFARESDTAAGAQQRAAAASRNASAQVGEFLLPIMQKAGEIVAKVTGYLSRNASTTRIVAGAVLGAAVAVKVLNAALNASPLARIVTAIAAVAAGLVLLYQKSETFRDIVNGVWTSVRTAAEAAWKIISAIIAGVVTAARELWQRFGSAITLVWNGIKAAASAAWSIVSGIIRAVAAVVTGNWKAFGSALTLVWNGIKAAASAAWSIVKGVILAVVGAVVLAWQGIVAVLTGTWNAVKSAASTVWAGISSVITAVVTAVQTAWSAVTEFFRLLWDGISTAVGTVWSGIQTAITSVVTAIETAWNALTEFFRGLWEGIKEIVRGVWDWIMQRIADIKAGLQALVSSASLVGNSNVGQILPNVGGSAPGGGGAAGGGMPLSYHAGAPVSIVVNGAGDPDAVARRVMSLLEQNRRRQGGVVIGP